MDKPMPMEGASLTPSSSDNFTDAQHNKQDEQVTLAASEIFTGKQQLSEIDCAALLECIIDSSEGKLQVAFTNTRKAIKLMRENPKLVSALQKAWTAKDYKEIRKSELLTVPKTDKDEPVEQKKATEGAWTTQYRGEAPTVLWTQIKAAMKEPNRYARYLEIVQSSGTGKSRMIEELSKTHLVIPINLRGPDESGYPPPDGTARAYICGTTSQKEARVHAVAFLRAVFKEASKLITKLRSENMDCPDQIEGLFSKYMSEGMTWESHGGQRQSFYDEVDLGANLLEGEIKQAFATNNKSSIENQLALCEAFQELIETLSSVSMSPPANSSVRTRSCPKVPNPEPLVILAFDEARTLSTCSNEGWSHFSELRHALRALIDEPLFSLFLSTTGNVNALVPSSRKDLSGRVQGRQLFSNSPFAEVGFDHFAFKDKFNLRVVTGDEHLSHFGRPLWATRYDKGNKRIKSEIIQFAALKLRAGKLHTPGDTLSDAVKLTCLAQRLPIEFHSVTYASKVQELELVEGHMRILLRPDAGFESLTTVSASEPLLSEAAYWMMDPDATFKAAETLESCLEGYAIHKGDRGELLVMLLFILARDRAIGHPDNYGRPGSGRRWCSVPKFMNALFKFKRHPSYDDSLKALFANSKIFFNHWVKIHQHAIVDVQYLAQLMRRGAALLCANNQAGIDGVIPFLLAGHTIFPNNIGVILWQVKNDSKHTDKPDHSLFNAMNPYKLGILNAGDDILFIRIIFSLASKSPCLTRVKCQDDPKSYNLWVGGISPTVFSPVGDDASIWAGLLQATYGWEDTYKKTDRAVADLRRSMNPGTAEDEHHWKNWADFTAMGNIKKNDDEDESMDED